MTIRSKPLAAGVRPAAGNGARRATVPGRQAVNADPRWSDICSALDALRARQRYAVRIVDTDCACGTLLIAAVRHARVLGFTAIEGRGIDGVPAMIGRARAAAARLRDPAIGLTFDVADVLPALASEAQHPVDILLWHGVLDREDPPAMDERATAAGDIVIGYRHATPAMAAAA